MKKDLDMMYIEMGEWLLRSKNPKDFWLFALEHEATGKYKDPFHCFRLADVITAVRGTCQMMSDCEKCPLCIKFDRVKNPVTTWDGMYSSDKYVLSDCIKNWKDDSWDLYSPATNLWNVKKAYESNKK